MRSDGGAILAGSDPVYRLLGPLEVGGLDRPHPVPPGRQQIILAVLMLAANRVASIEELIDAIWDDDPPATARTQVQICVSGLRGVLAGLESDGGAAIVTQPPGYLLRAAADQIDVLRFERLVAAAHALVRQDRPEDAASTLRDALALWRGPALAGVPGRGAQALAAQLDEKRLGAVEAHADLELRLGRHHQLVADIGLLVEQYPLRERLRGQFMLALHRSGRQAEALEVYRAGRELLIEQLGLEPSDELRALHGAILAGDPSLQPAREITHPYEPNARPHQLPADIADFTGRDELVGEVERTLSGNTSRRQHAMRVVVIAGKPGIGKSALAVHAAHRLAHRFDDGQLYANLGGTRAQPVSPAEVLGRFLRALGIPGPALPDGVDERAEMFRTLLANRNVLVVLDDAASESQLQLLLPGSSSCSVIVTSRTPLTALAGAHVFEVDVLPPERAIALLGAVIGEQRVAAEPAAATALVRLVGGLPLALRIVAARLAARPLWSLAWMLERLADERRRLDELAHGEMMVRASFRLSYDGLAATAGQLLQLLGGLEMTSFPTWAAAAALDCHPFDAADLLEQLVDAQLLEIVALDLDGSPRYRFHDLIRLFAREQLELNQTPDRRLSAVGRVASGWLAIAERAHRLIYGGDYTVLHAAVPRWQPPAGYVDEVLTDPLGWLEAERVNLSAAVGQAADAGHAAVCWDLAVTMVALLESRCYFDDWEQTHQRALKAVHAAGDRRGAAALMCSLGSLSLTRAREGAHEWLRPALAIFTELGDRHGQALARRNLALLDLIDGKADSAAALFRLAQEDFQVASDPIGQAHVLAQLAQIESAAGHHQAAVARLHEALGMCREVGARRVEVQVRYRLSGLMLHSGSYQRAEEQLVDLLDVVRAGRDIVGEGRILHRLGIINARLGRLGPAARLLNEALALSELVRDQAAVAAITTELAAFGRELGVGLVAS